MTRAQNLWSRHIGRPSSHALKIGLCTQRQAQIAHTHTHKHASAHATYQRHRVAATSAAQATMTKPADHATNSNTSFTPPAASISKSRSHSLPVRLLFSVLDIPTGSNTKVSPTNSLAASTTEDALKYDKDDNHEGASRIITPPRRSNRSNNNDANGTPTEERGDKAPNAMQKVDDAKDVKHKISKKRPERPTCKPVNGYNIPPKSSGGPIRKTTASTTVFAHT
mmetsp:Transcript_11071/g.31496  ORF Transcript_11071/g.31496 Transcript_11071/m.31496 type:complete len:224 (-) Transcript_11071:446-1117(-)